MDALDFLWIIAKALCIAIGLLVLHTLLWLFKIFVLLPAYDPLRKLRGPDGTPMESHFFAVTDPQLTPTNHEKWKKEYGHTFRFHGFGKHDYRLLTFDFRAISHIFTSPVYEKPWQSRIIMGRLVGRGIISMEGHEHKIQRKLIAPAFSSQSIKHLTSIFISKAEEACNIWEKDLKAQQTAGSAAPVVDVTQLLSRAAFDAIGLGGFGYAFDSVKDEASPDRQPFNSIFRIADQGIDLRDTLDLYVPILRKLWPTKKVMEHNRSRAEIKKFGRKLFALKKAKILAGDNLASKDILGLLAKANLGLSSSIRLSDEVLLDQCSTFLFAGSDSVALGICWALHQLANHPSVQTKLYEELKASLNRPSLEGGYESDRSDDSGFAEGLDLQYAHSGRTWESSWDKLPYLDSVIRETLRLNPPVHSTTRVPVQDDEIPLAEPVLVDGRLSNTIKIRKGTIIHIPIEGVNLAEDVWGPDALEFKPERWSKLPESAAAVPGYGSVLTFGYGPHSCVGQRFAITEMKAFIATMILRFEFKPVEGQRILKYNSFVTRPFVASIGNQSPQLPMHLTKRQSRSS